MKSAILEKGEQWFTDVSKILSAMNNVSLDYNWLITDVECHAIGNNKEISDFFYENEESQRYVWLTGEELTNLLKGDEIQFIWGVFSGFSADIKLQDVLEYPLPYADGNADFWIDNPQIQHPLATVEIVAWDSSLVILLSRINELVDDFLKYFPLAEDLCEMNTKDNRQIKFIETLLKEELKNNNIPQTPELLHKKYLVWHSLQDDKYTKDENKIRGIIKNILNEKR